jgi:hypothetical protein
MSSKIFKSILVIALVVFVFHGGCKDSITTSDAFSKPVIWLNTFEMSFAASEFGPNPSDEILQIKNTGQGTLSYNIEDDANFYDVDWLSIIPTNGSATEEGVQEHTVSVDKTGLAARDEAYTAKITITSNDAYNTPQRVDVSLVLTEEQPPEIGVSPANVSFAARVGGSNPAAKTFTVQNLGESTLNYQITWDAAWFSVSPQNGTSGTEQISHTVTVDASGLSEGSYTGLITVADANATNSPQTVNVNLEVSAEPPPEIWLSTGSLSFSAREGGSDPSSQSFTVRNSGEGTLDYQVSGDESWMGVSPGSGSLQEDASQTHTVSVDIGGLAEGTYRGTITATDPNAANSPQTIDVTLRISTQPPPATDNEVSIGINPSSGGTGTNVIVTISIKGNLQPIQAFGMDLTFDQDMFQFIGSSNGSLTGSWGSGVSAFSPSPGLVRVGGWGGTNSIPVGSTGSLIKVTLRVTCNSCNDGLQRQVCINNFTDDIAGMTRSPGCRMFTFNK